MQFENIHKNKKWAFIDGALCGVLVTVWCYGVKKTFREMKATEASRVVFADKHSN